MDNYNRQGYQVGFEAIATENNEIIRRHQIERELREEFERHLPELIDKRLREERRQEFGTDEKVYMFTELESQKQFKDTKDKGNNKEVAKGLAKAGKTVGGLALKYAKKLL